jgi:predicted transcriptional regulator
MADDEGYFEQDDTGKITSQYDDDKFIEAVAENEPASTSEVAETVGCSRRNADVRLKQLTEDGEVRSKKIGNSLSWMIN